MSGRVSLTQAVTLEAHVRSPDGAGGFGESWQVLGQLMVQIRALSARRIEWQAQEHGQITWEIVLRALGPDQGARPRSGQRFRQGARLWQIEAVAEYGMRGRWLRCLCRELEASL